MTTDHHRPPIRRWWPVFALSAAVLATLPVTVALRAEATTPPEPPPSGLYELPADTIESLQAEFAGRDDPASAVDAGWPATGRCIEGTGWTFTARAAIFDGVIDPERPELLVFAAVDEATRLVAVGWMSSAPAQLLGVPLALEGDVWVLYAWIGLDNPAGMLAKRHPAIAPCTDGLPDVDLPDAPPASDSVGSEPLDVGDSVAPPPSDSTMLSTVTTSSSTTIATTVTPTTTTAPPTTSPSGFAFTVSATTIDFGTVPVGKSVGSFIDVTNTSSVTRRIAIAHEPTGPLFPTSSNCNGDIDPGDSCRVSYSFEPERAMAPFSTLTSFRLACCGGQTLDVTITLIGAAIDAPPASDPLSDPPAVDPDAPAASLP